MVGINVMHTNFNTMGRVLDFVRNDCGWKGPLGAYPDHGVFKAPEWVFKELDNSEAISYIDDWVQKYNVQLVGGCCYEESAAAASLRRSWLVAGGTMCRNEARACLLSYTVPPTACAAMPSLLPARCAKLQRREHSIACRTIDFWRHLDRAVSQAKPRRLSCRA